MQLPWAVQPTCRDGHLGHQPIRDTRTDELPLGLGDGVLDVGTARLPPELAQAGRTGVGWYGTTGEGVSVPLRASVISNRSAGQRFPAV